MNCQVWIKNGDKEKAVVKDPIKEKEENWNKVIRGRVSHPFLYGYETTKNAEPGNWKILGGSVLDSLVGGGGGGGGGAGYGTAMAGKMMQAMQGGGGRVNDPLKGNASVEITIATGGNPDLRPELADTVTAGFVFQPKKIKGLQLSVDWYDINLKDAVGQFGANAQGVTRDKAEQLARTHEAELNDLKKLEQGMQSAVRDLQNSQRKAATKMREALGELQQAEIERDMQRNADWIKRGKRAI